VILCRPDDDLNSNYIRNNNSATLKGLTLSSDADYPLVLNESKTDEYKGIIFNCNYTGRRYKLLFNGGNLSFTYEKLDGTIIKEKILTQ
jgi:hypothetical protein